ncbi:MAG: hypothetical protein LBJ13_03570, partial [Puniceicoccales bacterium]|nr:hypothetical protein [Puniceicoccales bacterium]
MNFDAPSGAQTVSVPAGAISPAVVEAALQAAFEAGGTEAAVEIRIPGQVDAVTGEPAEVREVRVEIPVGDLRAVAASEVENVRIVSGAGEVTLNTEALKDLITNADERSAAAVEIVIARNAGAGTEDLTP